MALRRLITQPNFDSTLEPAQPGRPAKLTINLKVTLVPLDPSVPWAPTGTQLPPTHLAASKAHFKHGQVKDYNNTAVACRSWLVQEWGEYKVRFKRAVEHAWNNQMILLPTGSGDAGDGLSDQDYRQFIGDPKIQAHAEGAIDITLMPLNVVGHALIEVAHLENAGSRFRVWMHRIMDESVQFARHEDKKWPGWFTGQITAAHEVGHWLRSLNSTHFEHIDAEYAKILPPRPRQGTVRPHPGTQGGADGRRQPGHRSRSTPLADAHPSPDNDEARLVHDAQDPLSQGRQRPLGPPEAADEQTVNRR